MNENTRSITVFCSGGRSPSIDAPRQKSASRFCASFEPPRASPSASITALSAPAEVPEMPSISSRSSSSRWSSTPHVKAPCAPPPCSARLIFFRPLPPPVLRLNHLIAGDERSFRGPAPVDRQVGAGDLRRSVGAEVDGQRGDLVDGDELL